MTGTEGLRLREAGAADWEAVAALHIASWRSAYRGILRDAYLDGPIEAERRAVWRERLADGPQPGQIVIVAEDGEEMIALACILAGQDPRWGSLIDNMHVRPDRKRAGIGRITLAAAAARIGPDHAATPLHLTVFEANGSAIAAYERWGGRLAERLGTDAKDGRRLPVRRYAWNGPDALAAALGAKRNSPA